MYTVRKPGNIKEFIPQGTFNSFEEVSVAKERLEADGYEVYMRQTNPTVWEICTLEDTKMGIVVKYADSFEEANNYVEKHEGTYTELNPTGLNLDKICVIS